jgi:uncharacterized membrane protein
MIGSEVAALAQQTPSRSRLAGIDLGRALALIAMLDAHGYDGWVAPAARAGLAFGITRLVATLALPAFLVLAGMSLALQVRAGIDRGQPARELRGRALRRGALLVLGGYGFSTATAWLDGGLQLQTLLRADVLHAIGLSLMLLAGFGIRAAHAGGVAQPGALRRASVWLGLTALLGCPWLSLLGARIHGPLRYVLALVLDVPGVTRMPVVPLLAWACAGALLGLRLPRTLTTDGNYAAFSARVLLPLGLAAIALGVLAQQGLAAGLQVVPARTNVGIWANAVDLLGRATLLLAAGGWLAPRLHAGLRAAGIALGRHSLLLYVLHLPLCYGRLAFPLARALRMAQATLCVGALLLGCTALALGLERIRRSRHLAG